MIIDALIRFVQGMIDALMSFLPVYQLPALETFEFLPYTQRLNRVVPINLAVTLLVASIALRIAFNLWDFVVFVYHQFWGSN